MLGLTVCLVCVCVSLLPCSFSFVQRGDAKLFDFGLAKELSSLTPDDNGTYKLTGMSKLSAYRMPT